MRRLPLTLALCLLGVSGMAQDAPAKVSYSTRAARAETVLADLSKVTHLNLSTSPQTANEVIVISASDVPVQDLLAKIAQVTSAEWREDSSGFKLVPAVGIRNREESDALSARVGAIRKSINDKITAGKAKPTTPGKKPDDADEAMFSDPSENLLYQIAARTDLAAIASLGPNDRVVFSTQPTRTQRRFTSDITGLVNQIVAEHNKSVAQSPGVPDNAELDKMPEYFKEMMGRMTKPVGQVSKALFIVSRMSMGVMGMNQAELRLYDPQGKVAFTRPLMLDIPGASIRDMLEEVDIPTPPGATKPKPKTQVATPVELSPDSKAFLESFGGRASMGSTGVKISDSIREKIYRPDLYDPLSFVATDEVLALAKKASRPVVALLPDDSISMMGAMTNRKPTVEAFEKRLAKGTEIKLVADDAWLVIKPARPSEARAGRLDRNALAQLLAATLSKGMPSLDDLAAYALRAPSPMEGGLGAVYVGMLVPGAFSTGISGFLSWEALRFYGALGQEPRRILAQGGRIPFSALTPYQHEQVARMAFGAMPTLEVADPSGKKQDAFPSYMRMFLGGGGNDYRTEPTELLPTGIPGNGYVELKLTREPFASPIPPEGSTVPAMMSIMDADMLALFNMFKSDNEGGGMADLLPQINRVRIGKRDVFAFNFQLDPAVSMHQTLSDNSMPKGAPEATLSNLPADFQKLIAERQAALKASPFGQMIGMAGAMGATRGVIKP